jgi:hypothetical protein
MAEPVAGRPHMPGYGIAETDEGLLPWSWAEERLTRALRYWVTTVSSDRTPHTMPVWAVWVEDQLWFSTGGRTRKIRNLRANPSCTVVAEGEDPLVLSGEAEPGTPPASVLDAYRRKYEEAPPDTAQNPIVRVRPLTVFGLVEADFTTSPTRWTF